MCRRSWALAWILLFGSLAVRHIRLSCSTIPANRHILSDSIAVPLPSSISSLRQTYLAPGDHYPETETSTTPRSADTKSTATQIPPLFPVVALGGTFDHLHAGHKILLSMGAWITSQKIIVGITGVCLSQNLSNLTFLPDDALLKNKSNKHLLELLPSRISGVRAFLSLFKPGLIYDIVPIDDVYGPTGWDPNIQALVVSKETLGGATSSSCLDLFSLPLLTVL